MKLLSHTATAVVSAGLTLVVVWLTGTAGPERRADRIEPPATRGQGTRDARSSPTLEGAPGEMPQRISERERQFLADALVRERERVEAARIRASDSGLDVLARVIEHRADPGTLLGEFDQFQAHVPRVAAPTVKYDSTGDITKVSGREKPTDPLIIELGPGRFHVGNLLNYWQHEMPDVTSVEVRGSGMDETFVVAHDDLVTVKRTLKHLRLADFTFEASGGHLIDSRGDVAAVLERVRIEGVEPDREAAALYLHGRFYLACKACEFRNVSAPMRIHGQGLALFDGCAFIGVQRGFSAADGAAQGSHVTLRNCAWRDSPVATGDLQYRDAPEYAVEVHGGSVALGRPGLLEEDRRRRWGAASVSVRHPPTFGPSESTRTLALMLRILEDGSLPGGQSPTALRLIAEPRSGPARYLLSTFDPRDKQSRAFDAWVDATAIELRPSTSSAEEGAPPEGALALTEIIRRCGEPLGTPCDRIHYATSMNTSWERVSSVNVCWRNTLLALRASDAGRLNTPWQSEW